MLNPVYIKGAAAISPQRTFRSRVFPDEIIVTENNILRCIEPIYTDYLNPVMARRMGRVVKLGITAALECLNDAKIEMPGAIIAGTALGCLGDTEKFLKAIIQDDEQFLTPTFFIQSIQNTVSAQIALHLKCTNHNFTFVHKGFSFESAVLDSMMLVQDNEADDVLVGGIDELTDHNFHIYNRLGIWKKENIRSTDLLKHPTSGTIAGEGSVFFVLNKQQSPIDYAKLNGVNFIYDPKDATELQNALHSFLLQHKLTYDKLDLVLLGLNGDPKNDHFYPNLNSEILKSTAVGYFKHLCGDYQTSGAFAMWMAATILKSGSVPKEIRLNDYHSDEIKNVLIINNYENNFVLSLLSSCNF